MCATVIVIRCNSTLSPAFNVATLPVIFLNMVRPLLENDCCDNCHGDPKWNNQDNSVNSSNCQTVFFLDHHVFLTGSGTIAALRVNYK